MRCLPFVCCPNRSRRRSASITSCPSLAGVLVRWSSIGYAGTATIARRARRLPHPRAQRRVGALYVAAVLGLAACHPPEEVRRVRICGAAQALCWSDCDLAVVEHGTAPRPSDTPTPCHAACGAGFERCKAAQSLSCSGQLACAALDAEACNHFVDACTPQCRDENVCARACASGLLVCNTCVPYLAPR